ncbi:putative glucose 1-dehydrogenase domain protein [Mycobacterium xenopi 4042]|uniref:Putative glucose 1-dehydrogenase domain protein n=1 Tax=Mycobacterium xenopi 4042 TaxID=1299334 RepID=X8E5R0_MYCXE|nr:putative glucose 1-dehydrogenase domain protein [Mycobacterium xenopi 4042]
MLGEPERLPGWVEDLQQRTALAALVNPPTSLGRSSVCSNYLG